MVPFDRETTDTGEGTNSREVTKLKVAHPVVPASGPRPSALGCLREHYGFN